MLTPNKKLIILSLACIPPLLVNAAGNGTREQSLGTFEDPSVHTRPKFRYWIPDASVSHSVVARDVQAAAAAGAGGLECLGFYLYGGPPTNGGAGVAAPVSWAKYGFGTDEWNSLFKSMVQATKDNNLILDFAMGPNQGNGVPASIDSDGLMWDLVIFNSTVPLGGSFDAILPGWGTGTLEAAVTGLVTKSEAADSVASGFLKGYTEQRIQHIIALGLPGGYAEQRTQYTLAEDSLEDVTNQTHDDGYLSVQFGSNKQQGLHNTVFAIYLVHSHWRAQGGPKDIGGPQTPAYSIAQNGSWAVDHFSRLGAETTTKFWEQHILQNGTRELLKQVGNYAWEDSVEIQSNVYWTKDMRKAFYDDHGYSIAKYLPVLLHGNGLGADSNPPIWWITDEPGHDLSRTADYRKTLGKQYREYLSTLSAWARDYLGLKFSAQVSYNLRMDMVQLANIPSVDAPECESLDFSDLIDGYRQYAGPAHLAGKPVLSSECGAVPHEAFAQTLPELLWKVKRSYAGSINHTQLCMALISLLGRTTTGTLRIDVAFWQKKLDYAGHTTARTYVPDDLELAGYTYEYLSPDNFDLPNARVRDHVLAPDAQAFKGLILRANDSMTVEGAMKLSNFARDGLPIIFSGGIPSTYLGTNSPGAVQKAQKALENMILLSNVHVTTSPDGLAAKLASIGVHPATKFESSTPSWYTLLRSDSVNEIDFYYVYNDVPYAPLGEGSSNAIIEFSSTGYPYTFDAWTGERTPMIVYKQSNVSTTVHITLAGNQSTVIAFSQQPLANHKPTTHLESVSDNVIGLTVLDNGSILLKATGSSISYMTASGKNGGLFAPKTNPMTLTNWNLTVEHWDPPSDLLNIEDGAAKHNTTHVLPHLISWQQVSGLQNVSGRGFYSTSFRWPPADYLPQNSSIGAIIDFGPVVHTLTVQLNGNPLPPLDVTSATADISQWLVEGENTVLAEVATPLGNVLRPIWDQLKTSGTGPSDFVGGVPAPVAGNYGLIKDVIIQPYWNIVVS
ncbi:hypothetical protein EG329_000266 [Mollisiaceae sp. DMI_Dod_QoI]|nr:hypothetical protein EG329_000266 [Helotiales sp. DMI_Dod_QoI]